MSLSPFGRRGGFYDAHSEVNRLLDEMFGGLGRRAGGRGRRLRWSGPPQWTSFKRMGTL
jgi:hypothetical protein